MANPQKENGYTGIANEIVEKLSCANLNGSEFRMILFVLRKTYGFQKTSDFISLTQFERGTGMKRSHVCTTLKSLLVHKRILVKVNNLCKFNKNWNEWVVHKRGLGSPQKHNQVVHKSIHTKETIQKKEDIADKSAESPPKEKTDFKKYESLYLSLLAEYKLPPAMISYGKFRKNLPKVLLYLEEQKETIENYWRWYLDEFHFKENGSDVFATDKYGTEPSTTLSSYFVSKFIKEK